MVQRPRNRDGRGTDRCAGARAGGRLSGGSLASIFAIASASSVFIQELLGSAAKSPSSPPRDRCARSAGNPRGSSALPSATTIGLRSSQVVAFFSSAICRATVSTRSFSPSSVSARAARWRRCRSPPPLATCSRSSTAGRPTRSMARSSAASASLDSPSATPRCSIKTGSPRNPGSSVIASR